MPSRAGPLPPPGLAHWVEDPPGLVVLVTTVVMAGSRHLSGAALCCLWGVLIHWLLLAAAKGMAFTDPHFPDGEIGPLHVREGHSF